VIDAVVAAEQLPELVDRSLRVLLDNPEQPTLPRRDPTVFNARPAWESVGLTRRPGRTGVRDLLRYGATDTLRLRGTDEGERDEAVVVALTRLDGQPCVLVGQDRTKQSAGRAMGPAALREARRAMNLAEELRLPLVTVIDTPGAELSVAAEERAVAGEIARCIATMTRMQVPTLAVLLGQGCGGGALALLPARRVLAAQNAWLSPLPPEGASVIVHGDTQHAEEMATRQHIRSVDLAARGTVHRVVPEHDDDDAASLARAVAAECAAMLVQMRSHG
jgi:acetyl-CoA carboxylase carboxyl transferase subunit beta